jgi:hypothetical protein
MMLVAIILQRAVVPRHFDDDVTTFAAIAAVGPTPRYVLLPTKAQRAGASVAALDENFDPVRKHEKRIRRDPELDPD